MQFQNLSKTIAGNNYSGGLFSYLFRAYFLNVCFINVAKFVQSCIMPSCAMVCDDEFVFYRLCREFLHENTVNSVHEGNEMFKVTVKF